MSVEVGAVGVEREHEEQCSVQARRGDAVGGEAGDRGLEGLAERHGSSISPRCGSERSAEARRAPGEYKSPRASVIGVGGKKKYTAHVKWAGIGMAAQEVADAQPRIY